MSHEADAGSRPGVKDLSARFQRVASTQMSRQEQVEMWKQKSEEAKRKRMERKRRKVEQRIEKPKQSTQVMCKALIRYIPYSMPYSSPKEECEPPHFIDGSAFITILLSHYAPPLSTLFNRTAADCLLQHVIKSYYSQRAQQTRRSHHTNGNEVSPCRALILYVPYSQPYPRQQTEQFNGVKSTRVLRRQVSAPMVRLLATADFLSTSRALIPYQSSPFLPVVHPAASIAKVASLPLHREQVKRNSEAPTVDKPVSLPLEKPARQPKVVRAANMTSFLKQKARHQRSQSLDRSDGYFPRTTFTPVSSYNITRSKHRRNVSMSAVNTSTPQRKGRHRHTKTMGTVPEQDLDMIFKTLQEEARVAKGTNTQRTPPSPRRTLQPAASLSRIKEEPKPQQSLARGKSLGGSTKKLFVNTSDESSCNDSDISTPAAPSAPPAVEGALFRSRSVSSSKHGSRSSSYRRKKKKVIKFVRRMSRPFTRSKSPDLPTINEPRGSKERLSKWKSASHLFGTWGPSTSRRRSKTSELLIDFVEQEAAEANRRGFGKPERAASSKNTLLDVFDDNASNVSAYTSPSRRVKAPKQSGSGRYNTVSSADDSSLYTEEYEEIEEEEEAEYYGGAFLGEGWRTRMAQPSSHRIRAFVSLLTKKKLMGVNDTGRQLEDMDTSGIEIEGIDADAYKDALTGKKRSAAPASNTTASKKKPGLFARLRKRFKRKK